MTQNFDVVIIGASFGGVAAALAAADANVSVALLEPSQWIGGQATAQGVTRWDEAGMDLMETTGSTHAYQSLRNTIRNWFRANAPLSGYGQAQTYFNPGFAAPNYPFAVDPSVTHAILKNLVAQHGNLSLRTGTQVVSAQVAGGSVQSVTTASDDVYTAKVFLDATDLGDVLPMLGITWHIGAEAQSDTQEPDAPA